LLSLHDESLAEHGGASGIRDMSLLESALARPQQLANYGAPDVFELASSYAFGLAKNHAFVDGNKRAAFLACGLFLLLNGQSLMSSQQDASEAVLGLAAGTVTELEFALWLRAHCQAR
jgi:death on curing protein